MAAPPIRPERLTRKARKKGDYWPLPESGPTGCASVTSGEVSAPVFVDQGDGQVFEVLLRADDRAEVSVED
jgi:hypothetical protein